MYQLLLLAMVWRVGMEHTRRRNQPTRKIVTLKSALDKSDYHEALRDHGGRIVKHLPLVNALVCEFPSSRGRPVTALHEHPEVLDVEEDFQVQILDVDPPGDAWPHNTLAGRWRWRRTGPQPPQQIGWNIERIHAPEAWATSQGQNVKIGVIDTGIDLNHPDLKENIAGSVNMISPNRDGNDDNGHGTHVAGVLAALNNEIGVVGVAPQASLYAVKAIDFRGVGKVSDIIEGIDWCTKNGIELVNLSFGSRRNSRALKRAVEAAHQAGIIMVAAAGNSPDEPVTYPARYPEVVAVSAITPEDSLARFSSRGPEVTLTAPGQDIRSTYLYGGYKTLSGTSMAAPHVTGTAALVLAAGTTADEVRRRLLATAQPLPELKPGEDGHGLVDALAAVNTLELPAAGRGVS